MRQAIPKDANRRNALGDVLRHARNQSLARIRELRGEQEADVTAPPSDEMDVARSLADVETHASLIERAEFQLKAIDAAFSRLERGRYGLCEECGEEIPLVRLKLLPFAAFCVDCQTKRNRQRRVGEGSIDEPSRYRWAPPEEMDESLEKQDALMAPEEQIIVHDEGPFGPEVGEFEQTVPVATARRRGRPKKRDQAE
ncbi:MAG TPA: TraR/DksA family transcriptional regulator [Candidatus Binataceae bacterium]|nr:TraR/DksA family transcriptional regulator [Candidatus Binataceae bacterium]